MYTFLCSVEWYGSDLIDPENESHEEYLASFKRTMIENLRQSIDASMAIDPDGKGKKKTVQVRIRQLLSINYHISFSLFYYIICNKTWMR